MSRIRGTRRIQEVTGGHERDPIQVQEEPRGYHRTREDTASARFGTVRHHRSEPDWTFVALLAIQGWI